MRKPCFDRADTNKGAWSKQEDQKLTDYVRAHGEGCWQSLPQAAGFLQRGKSRKLRWMNYLRPDLKRGNFTEEEDDLIIRLHGLLGNRWSLIAGRLPGRMDNEVKSYWNSHLKRKLIRMGIDPQNRRTTQSFPLLRPQSVASATSSPVSECQEFGSLVADEDPLSDTASCLGDNKVRVLPDLNLDLTISIPYSVSNHVEGMQQCEELKEPSGLGNTTSPTLFSSDDSIFQASTC